MFADAFFPIFSSWSPLQKFLDPPLKISIGKVKKFQNRLKSVSVEIGKLYKMAFGKVKLFKIG